MGLIPTLNAPTTGDPRVPAPLVANDNAIRTVVNGQLDTNNISPAAGILGSQLSPSAAIAGTQLSASAAIADTQLASPNNSVYRPLLRSQGVAGDGATAATYFFVTTANAIATSPVTLVSFSTASAHFASIYLASTDYTVAGKTTKLRVRGVVSENTVTAAITFTFGLYPVTFAGVADTLTATLGTVVASSTAAISSPATSASTTATSSDISLPSDGHYALGVVLSGTVTAQSAVMLSATLDMRHV